MAWPWTVDDMREAAYRPDLQHSLFGVERCPTLQQCRVSFFFLLV